MTFQALDLKENYFLNCLDDKLHTVEPLYTKGSLWSNQFGHSNSLCARATGAITNIT